MTALRFKTSARKINSPKPLLVVLSAPSGAGKSTIVDSLLKRNRNFVESVSATTRPRRKGERHRRDYFFLSQEEFRNKKRAGEFVETAEVFGEWYGTPRASAEEAIARGRTVLFDIDIEGGQAVKRWRPDAVLIFVLPPDMTELRKRLTRRRTESKQARELRLARALKEIRTWSKYDYIVCNDKLTKAVELIEEIIRAESQSVKRFQTSDFFRRER